MRLFARCASAALLLLVPLCAVPTAAADPGPAAPGSSTPTMAPLQTSSNAVAGRYIITLKDGLDPSAVAAQTPAGVTPLFTYTSALHGYAADLTPAQLDAVRKLPGVAAVEEDGVVSVPRGETIESGTRAKPASWGLDRIDQANLPLDGQFNVNGDGAGVNAYIVDTGIDYAHTEFGGRATFGYDAIKDGRTGLDCNGHGTHVAGTVGGKTYGVARKVNLISVRVLNCDGKGSWSGIIAGFDWVAEQGKQPAVLNASLGGPKSKAMDRAANDVSDKGILAVVAAGNDSIDACGVSPAGAERTVTVGATNRVDQETDFSNYGECLWMYAPGEAIVSAKLGGGSVAEDGTSMASPHVAGVAALYKAKNPTASSEDIAIWLADQSTKNVLSVSKGSPNYLLYTAGL